MVTGGRGVRILDEDDVRASIDMASCIEACARAFAAYSAGSAETPAVIHLDVPESRGEIHVKAGHLHGQPFYAVKVSSGFYGSDPAAIDGLVVAFAATDGAPAAFLLDGGYLTDLRTGAAGGVAARHLAPERVGTVAVIGTGLQARYQLDALALERPGFESVRVWGRTPSHVAACVSDLADRPGLPAGCLFEAAATPRDAVAGADLVITCTASRAPLVEHAWLEKGAHLTAVGSDGVGKQELDPSILEAADLIAVDDRAQAAAIGELQHADVEPGNVAELGEIVGGSKSGRTGPDQLTVCDLTGLGVQDVAALNVVMANVGDRGDVIEL
jgi:ornithine cyclodeaminase/alanine dehydrogenase-like protein (mu-crystallin family)